MPVTVRARQVRKNFTGTIHCWKQFTTWGIKRGEGTTMGNEALSNRYFSEYMY